MTDLLEGQYELTDDLGHSLVFGGRRGITVQKRTDSAADARLSDVDMPDSDGIRFGRDFFGGREITFDLNILVSPVMSEDAALVYADDIAAQWRGDYVRTVPGAVQVLRYKLAGRTRRVYGRSRKFSVTTGATRRGWIPATATFKCTDDRYYEDSPTVSTVQLVPPPITGLMAPLMAPLTAGSTGASRSDLVTIDANVASIPVISITAPNGITNPVIEQVGGWSITVTATIPPGRTLTIDPRSWHRSIELDDGANYAGKLTQDSPWIDQIWLEPGEHHLVLRGLDPTGTASMTTECHAAHASI